MADLASLPARTVRLSCVSSRTRRQHPAVRPHVVTFTVRPLWWSLALTTIRREARHLDRQARHALFATSRMAIFATVRAMQDAEETS